MGQGSFRVGGFEVGMWRAGWKGGGAAGRSPVRAAPQGWRGSPRRGRSAAMGGLHRVVGIDRARGKWES